MDGLSLRPTKNGDLPNLMGMDHSSTTDRVWQLEVRRDAHLHVVSALFREVRLPRPVRLAYPNDPFALADEWKRKAMMWTAWVGQSAVGYLGLTEPRPQAMWITDLAVDPGWRRKGVARALLSEAHAWCTAHGCDRVFFGTLSKNYPAIALVQEDAYEYCGYNDRYYASNDIMLVFVRTL